jgi:hypothetical protein
MLITRLVLLFICLMVFPLAQPDSITDAVVLVSAGKGSGTGFILRDEETDYMVTNTHVLAGGEPLRVTTLDGHPIELGALQVSNRRDLARVRLAAPAKYALTLDSSSPSIGDIIHIYGNSEGTGVATRLGGEVQGIGPELLEVNAKFVQGNSGSPIVNEAGRVVGVATFAVRHSDPDNWLRQDSRFRNIRRYGVRYEGIEWVDMDFPDFHKRADLLADLTVMAEQLYRMRFTNAYYDARQNRVVYALQTEIENFSTYPVFAREMEAFAVEINGVWEWIQGVQQSATTHNSTRDQQARRHALRDYKMSSLMTQQKFQIFISYTHTLRGNIRRRLAHDQWGTDYFLEEAKSLYQVFNALLDFED